MFDLIIKDGDIADGSGGEIRQADVAIQEDRIAALEPGLRESLARSVIHAQGRIVCPGFIDVHSHSDAYLLLEPAAPSKLFQGITTEVVGNCGASAAPCHGNARLPSDWQSHAYPGTWSDMREYRRLLEAVSPAVNVVALVGHNILRAGVLGYEGRAATPGEMAVMIRRLEECMDAGARGLSTGLIYPPGMYASREELLALASVVASRNGVYASHMRSEGGGLLESLQETIDVARTTGVTTQVSHLKTSGRANWPLIDKALDLLKSARKDGIRVAADRYPYTASCTELDVLFPNWATEGGRDAELARLRDPVTRARLRREILATRTDRSWGSITIGSTSEANSRFRGMPLEEAARALGLEPLDAALHLIETDALSTTAFFQGMGEENMWRILAEPWVMIGSDASLRAPWGPLGRDYPHPRAYGAFTVFLRAALDGKTVSLPEAVRKMTALPASHFQLRDRGTLRPGAFADIVVVDPPAVRAHASYADPHRLSEGITDIIVNGTPELLDRTLTGYRVGRWL